MKSLSLLLEHPGKKVSAKDARMSMHSDKSKYFYSCGHRRLSVCVFVCVSVCVSVSTMTQKIINLGS